MAILTKTQLSASNATSFPDNVSGFITPSLLRNFNTSSIDSYASLSGSNTFVGNQVITGSVIATSFTGSLQGTASWANNALTASFANSSNSSSLLITASVSNDIIDFTKGNNSTFSITVNNVKNSSTASVISVGGDNTNASRKIVFVGTTVASVNEQLLIAANAPDLTYNPTTNVINATASYASVAESANTIGATTFSGVQTYTYSQNKVVGSAGGWNNTITQKFITGSFQVVSGSYQKFMSIAQSGSDSGSWRANGTIMGSVVSSVELAIANFGFSIRASNSNAFLIQAYGDPAIDGNTQALLRPEFSGSWNASTNAMDLYARMAYNNIGSMLVEMTLNLIQSGSTPSTPNISYTFY